MKKVSVSFLSSKNPSKDLIKLNSTVMDYIHVDYMDGKFVKNKNDPFKILNKLSSTLTKRLDVHIMAKKPLSIIDKYASLNTEYITVPVEIDSVDKCLARIKEYSIKCGLAINPETDLSIINQYLDKIDLLLIMSVSPGRGGQAFIEDTYEKIRKIKKVIEIKKAKVKLSVDGGINDINSKKLDAADIVVSGSYIISSTDFNEAIKTLKQNK